MTLLTVGTAALGAATTIGAGQQADEAGKMQQAQADARAKEEYAAGQRVAATEDRKKKLAQSALMAQAGASGSGASDATVERLALGIEEEGTYNARSAMAEGDARARAARYEGALARWQGKNAKRASYFDAAGTLIGSFVQSPMAKRYASPAKTSSGTGYS